MGRIVGIDLGTTHTVVAWADLAAPDAVHVFPIPQLVAATETFAQPLYPSCLYAPLEGEVTADPWDEGPWVSGELARRRGAEVPGRLVASAKSWLCHPSVDRTAPILPWGAEEGVPRISPVDASARFLTHLRKAYDAAYPQSPLAQADVVLTVPASFDEAARELTVLAATRAGLSVRLLEEPQAAFYDYMHRAGRETIEALSGKLVLVCDVGGGTTDLSLIRVDAENIQRVAVGHHLLLGGDNMDLALALQCEPRLGGGGSGGKLEAGQFAQLVAACRVAKEKLLGDDAPDDVAVTLLGRGASLVGATRSTRLTRDEVLTTVLDGFFPQAPKDARPERKKSGLVGAGLPYERDVAITRHVAWFFARHAPQGAFPSALLLNGGVFRAARVRERLATAIEAWGGPKLEVLLHEEPDLGVARGAVGYGLALRGHGVRIEGGAARGYYVGLDAAGDKRLAVCVVPRGARESVPQQASGKPLALVVGRPVRFDLFASDDARIDAPGDIVEVEEDRFQSLPPLFVSFDAATTRKGAAPQPIEVALEGELTAVGTLDLACVEVAGQRRRFRLAFQLRREEHESPPSRASALPPPSLGTRKLEEAMQAIDRAFGKEAFGGREGKDLLRELERILGERASWTTPLARALFDALLPLGKITRRRSADHERVFWLLAGYTVRPGFGDPADPRRVRGLYGLFADKLAFPEQARGWQQFWIAWRRAAAGLDEAAQTQIRDFVDPFLAPKEARLKRPKKWKPESEADMLDMAASLERVSAERRATLGGWVLERTFTDRDPRLFAAIGRIGARVPAYASLHHVVPSATVERWLAQLVREKWTDIPTAPAAAVQLARVTGDRARDLGERARREVEKKLEKSNASPEQLRAVRELVVVEELERAAFFGEGLPVGLRLLDRGEGA